jgi:hypothetical protein
MGLSNPNNANGSNVKVAGVLSLGSTLAKPVTVASPINQIRGISSPNSTGAGIPKHVTNVSASISTASKGTTTTVKVQFSRDPSDSSFGGVNVLVKGYQGNGKFVQVAGGSDSPVTFVLNNTGEAISVAVQATGNSGSAPLSGAPTTGAKLPKSTLGGFGTTTTTSSGGGGGSSYVLPWWNNQDGSPYCWNSGSGTFGPAGGAGAGIVLWYMFTIAFPVTLYRVSFRINGGGGTGCLVGCGVYSSDGTTKLISWDAISAAASGTDHTQTSTAVTLQPGTYIWAFGYTGGTGVPTTDSGVLTSGSSDVSESWNKGGFIRSGQSPNAIAAGVMPSSLGVLATTTNMPSLMAQVTVSPS